ncbi:hypothetical protein V6N11_083598 [Hibiscus sabdariffa]|uniref:Transmembrane protein n=1 Tax=Hibiscus sabdariffa TaxID=183260 RepID=A0ABR2QC40_9ROSI
MHGCVETSVFLPRMNVSRIVYFSKVSDYAMQLCMLLIHNQCLILLYLSRMLCVVGPSLLEDGLKSIGMRLAIYLSVLLVVVELAMMRICIGVLVFYEYWHTFYL